MDFIEDKGYFRGESRMEVVVGLGDLVMTVIDVGVGVMLSLL